MDTNNKINAIAMCLVNTVWACVLRLWRSLKLLLNAASAYRHPGTCQVEHRIAELNVFSKDIEVICEAPTSGTAPPYQGRVTAVQNFRVTYGTDQADRAGLPAASGRDGRADQRLGTHAPARSPGPGVRLAGERKGIE